MTTVLLPCRGNRALDTIIPVLVQHPASHVVAHADDSALVHLFYCVPGVYAKRAPSRIEGACVRLWRRCEKADFPQVGRESWLQK